MREVCNSTMYKVYSKKELCVQRLNWVFSAESLLGLDIMEAIVCVLSPEGDVEFPQAEAREERARYRQWRMYKQEG